MTPGAPRRTAANFGRVLEEVESAHASAVGLGKPFEISFEAMLPLEDARSDEDGAAWDQALAWVETTDGPPSAEAEASPSQDLHVEPRAEPAPIAPPSDDPAVIAAELGLAGAASLADLRRARRRFMWLNHPDRRPDVQPELANRRVAIANMLVDQAAAAFAAPPARRAP